MVKSHIVGEVQQSNANRNKGHSNDEKCWQNCSGSQDWLPRWESLLLKSTVWIFKNIQKFEY